MIKSRITDEELAILDDIALEISNAGHEINALHNCRNGEETYKYAIPILLKHINNDYSNVVKQEIAQAFATKDAYNLSYKTILYIYINYMPIKDHDRYQSLLAWALSEMMSKNDLDDMIKIIRSKHLGGSRIFFVRRILRFKFNQKQEIIDFMLSDPDLYKETQYRLKIKKARH